ncbi:MAG: hypothetical protein AAF656_04960 [Planctomycetota bacterium]
MRTKTITATTALAAAILATPIAFAGPTYISTRQSLEVEVSGVAEQIRSDDIVSFNESLSAVDGAQSASGDLTTVLGENMISVRANANVIANQPSGNTGVIPEVEVRFVLEEAMDVLISLEGLYRFDSDIAIDTALFSLSETLAPTSLVTAISTGPLDEGVLAPQPYFFNPPAPGFDIDSDANTITGRLEAGDYFITWYRFLFADQFGTEPVDTEYEDFGFDLSFTAVDNGGGVGGGDGGDGNTAVIPLPATAWGGIGLCAAAFVRRRFAT